MGLLSKLFCKEEPPTASSVPAPTLALEDEAYVPYGPERRSLTITCAGCGAQKDIPSRYEPGDWRNFTIKLTPSGRKYDNVVVCAECRPLFDAAVKERDTAYNAALQPWREAHSAATKYQADWDRVNPRPKIPSYPTKEVWIRRITCGCCGKNVDQEFDVHQTPGSVAWPRLVGGRYCAKICEDCFSKPEHVALREALEELSKRRDEQVGWRHREAEKLRPPWTVLEIRSGMRLTARLKKAFSA